MKIINLALMVLLSYSTIVIGCEEGQLIIEKVSDGSIVTLEDGSVWEVNRIDRSYIISWPPETEVIACGATLTKIDDGEAVEAMRIK